MVSCTHLLIRQINDRLTIPTFRALYQLCSFELQRGFYERSGETLDNPLKQADALREGVMGL